MQSTGARRDIKARALVAAAGGFQANIDWMKEIWGPPAANFHVRGTPCNRGTLLKMLMERGVKTVGDPAQCHAVAVDARSPKFDGGIATRIDSILFGIVVNRHARRFYDEGEDFWPKRYAVWGRLIAQQPDQIAYAIFDSKVSGRFVPSAYRHIVADSLPELAAKLALDPEELQRTIADFNAATAPGSPDYTTLDSCRTAGLELPKSHWATRIDSPPYFAYPMRPGITFTYLGARVNQEARVLLGSGPPVTNVFAAGEIMAGNVLGQGYVAGVGVTIGSVFGQVAGAGAARV